tara:strand:+ start:392 stop:754 length:363 start_codon:yes stop_codon:yes gene_type:complete
MAKKQIETCIILYDRMIEDIVNTYNYAKDQNQKIQRIRFTMPDRTVSKGIFGDYVDINDAQTDTDIHIVVEDQEPSADGFKKTTTYDVVKHSVPLCLNPIKTIVESPVESGYIRNIRLDK